MSLKSKMNDLALYDLKDVERAIGKVKDALGDKDGESKAEAEFKALEGEVEKLSKKIGELKRAA